VRSSRRHIGVVLGACGEVLDRQLDRAWPQYLLFPAVPAAGQAGPQSLVPFDEPGQGGAQGRGVQVSGEGDPQGDVEDLWEGVFGVHRGETGLLGGGGCAVLHRAGAVGLGLAFHAGVGLGLGRRGRLRLRERSGQVGRHGP
jgi:hypothetical protein